ncbi:chromate transporter, partial [Hydrogenophaga crassostreae]
NRPMVGGRGRSGLRGALAALAGMLAARLVSVLLLAILYGNVADTPLAQGALRGMGAVASGLITATGIKLIAALDNNPMGRALCIAIAAMTFVAIALLRWPLVWVLLGIGGVACIWTYRVLGLKERLAQGAVP